jgi:hypothetical protein
MSVINILLMDETKFMKEMNNVCQLMYVDKDTIYDKEALNKIYDDGANDVPMISGNKMYDFYCHDEQLFLSKILKYSFYSEDYFACIEYDNSIIKQLSPNIQMMFISAYILDYRENENGNIFISGEKSSDDYILNKYITTVDDFFTLIDTIILLFIPITPKNPYNIFDHDLVKNALCDLTNSDRPILTTTNMDILNKVDINKVKSIQDINKVTVLALNAATEQLDNMMSK